MQNFNSQIQKQSMGIQSVLCIGLDTVPEKIPAILNPETNPQLKFNQVIIDSTYNQACCYKINAAFYLVRGIQGLDTLIKTIEYAHEKDVLVILDTKWGDIGHTARYYAKTAFDVLNADAVTLNPYMGEDTIAPFREYASKCSFILCFTSNVSRSDFEMQPIPRVDEPQVPLYHIVAEKIRAWNTSSNLGIVAGATAPEELARVRGLAGPSIPILCPGVGVQGGDLEEVLWAGFTGHGSLLINVSRAVIHASKSSDFAEAAHREADMFVTQMRAFFAQLKEE